MAHNWDTVKPTTDLGTRLENSNQWERVLDNNICLYGDLDMYKENFRI